MKSMAATQSLYLTLQQALEANGASQFAVSEEEGGAQGWGIEFSSNVYTSNNVEKIGVIIVQQGLLRILVIIGPLKAFPIAVGTKRNNDDEQQGSLSKEPQILIAKLFLKPIELLQPTLLLPLALPCSRAALQPSLLNPKDRIAYLHAAYLNQIHLLRIANFILERSYAEEGCVEGIQGAEEEEHGCDEYGLPCAGAGQLCWHDNQTESRDRILDQFNLLMEGKLIVSRSVLIDPVYQKAQRVSYQKHKQQLQKIKERQCLVEDEEAVILAAKKKASIQHSSERVRNQLDPRKFENKAMVQHIKSIMKRKASEANIYRSKSTAAMREKKEIEKQNEILQEKIKEARSNKLTKKDLRRQFAEYQSQKNLLRKVKYDPKPYTQPHERAASHFCPNH